MTPPDELSSYSFSNSLDNFSDADFFLDDTATSFFADDSSNFIFNIPPLMPSTSDGSRVNSSTSSLDGTRFSLWAFDPPTSDSASFMTGHIGFESTVRPTPQTWERDLTPRDQDHGGAAVTIGVEPPAPTAPCGPEPIPERSRRMNWRIDREDEQVTDPSDTYDPLLEDLAGAMIHGKKDRHLQEQAAVIMKALMASSQACCHTTGINDGGHSELERQAIDLASLPFHEIIDACFDDPGGMNIFLDRSDIIQDTERLLGHTRGPLTAEAALVAHVCITRGLMLRSKLSVGHSMMVQFFWNTLLELMDHVVSAKDTIEKFIALVALLYVAETKGADFMDELLSSCFALARSLRLQSSEALEYLCAGHKKRIMVQRACWLLDCIDREHAMRTCLKLSWHSHMEFLIPERRNNNGGDGQDLLLLRHRYATLCSGINRRRALAKGKPNTPASDRFDDIVQSLEALQNDVPHDIRKMDPAMISRLDAETRRVSIVVCYYFHEAMLLLCSQCMYGGAAPDLQQDGSPTSDVYLRAKAICADSIRAIFNVGMHVGLEHYGTDAAFTRVPILALCILVAQLLRDPPSGPSRCSDAYRTSAPLLGMAAGIFGKLGMTAAFEDLFQHVAELCLLAGQWNIRGT